MSAFYGKAAEWEVWTLSWGMTMRGTDQGTITERAQHKHSAVYWHMCSQANQQRVSIEWFGSGLYSSYGSKYRYNCGIHQLRLEHTYISYLARRRDGYLQPCNRQHLSRRPIGHRQSTIDNGLADICMLTKSNPFSVSALPITARQSSRPIVVGSRTVM